MKPVKSILDPSFKYVNAVNTDVRKTWARARRELLQTNVVVQSIVVQLKPGKGK